MGIWSNHDKLYSVDPHWSQMADDRKEVREALEKNPLLERVVQLMAIAIEREYGWLAKSQGYYDSTDRTVHIYPDVFRIDATINHEEKAWGLSFTDFGYMPLHSYKSLETQTVIYVCAEVIKEKMIAIFKEFSFGEIKSRADDKGCYFSYSVPKLKFNDWF